MTRERVLKIVLVVIGVLFVAGIYPLVEGIRNPSRSNMGETMMLSLYVTLGVFLLIAARNPADHRSVIAFAAWSSFAHAATMVAQAIRVPGDRNELLVASALFAAIGAVLIPFIPARKPVGKMPAVTV